MLIPVDRPALGDLHLVVSYCVATDLLRAAPDRAERTIGLGEGVEDGRGREAADGPGVGRRRAITAACSVNRAHCEGVLAVAQVAVGLRAGAWHKVSAIQRTGKASHAGPIWVPADEAETGCAAAAHNRRGIRDLGAEG